MNPNRPLSKGQRDRALMLRTIDSILHSDYAIPWAHDRFSSIETHARSIYTTFDATQWDRNFYLSARRYLAEYRDPNLQILPPPELSSLDEGCGFDGRRHGNALYVTRVWGETPVKPGDAIVRLGSRTVAEVGHLGRFWIRENPSDRPSERWELALADASRATLFDGREIEIPHESSPLEPAPPRIASLANGTALVALEELVPVEVPDTPGGLVIDLRLCSDGDFDGIRALLPYCIDSPVELDSLFGSHVLRDTANNRLRLEAMRESGIDQRPQGTVEPKGHTHTVILTDRMTSGAAEYLAQAALTSDRCTVVGRPTGGSTSTSSLCAVELGDGYVLVYPAAADPHVVEDPSYPLGCGLTPHKVVPWRPGAAKDPDLEQALAVLDENKETHG